MLNRINKLTDKLLESEFLKKGTKVIFSDKDFGDVGATVINNPNPTDSEVEISLHERPMKLWVSKDRIRVANKDVLI